MDRYLISDREGRYYIRTVTQCLRTQKRGTKPPQEGQRRCLRQWVGWNGAKEGAGENGPEEWGNTQRPRNNKNHGIFRPLKAVSMRCRGYLKKKKKKQSKDETRKGRRNYHNSL